MGIPIEKGVLKCDQIMSRGHPEDVPKGNKEFCIWWP